MVGANSERTAIGEGSCFVRAGARSTSSGDAIPDTVAAMRSGPRAVLRAVERGARVVARAAAPAVAALALAAPVAHAQTLDEWIQRFGEAAAQQSPPSPSSPAAAGSGGAQPSAARAAAAVPAPAPATGSVSVTATAPAAGPSRPCGAAMAPGELVLRAGRDNDCGIERLTGALRAATQAMNERGPVRAGPVRAPGDRAPARAAAERSPANECGDDESCRRELRTERLKEVSALKHEDDQMARTHNAPRNVTIPPAKKTGGNWTWQTYQMGR